MVGQLDDAEVGLEGREGIVGDLRTRGRDHGKERRLPGVGLADQTDIGDQLELHLDAAGDAFFAGLPFSRRLVGGSGKERVALPAATAGGDHSLLPVFQNFGEDLTGFGVTHHSPRRNRHDDVGAGPTTFVGAHAVLATLGYPLVAVSVVEQGRQIGIAANDDTTAAPAVAAVRSAHWSAPFAAERSGAGPAGAALNGDYRFVDEHDCWPGSA